LSALLVGISSVLVGMLVAFDVSSSGYFSLQLSIFEIIALCLFFLLTIVLLSLFPALKGISLTQFLNTNVDFKSTRFSFSNVKFMLMMQYTVVMIVVILAFGMNKQLLFLKKNQVGGNDQTILVTTEQPEQVQEKFKILKAELLKHK
jgi:putative ABC transport system permease protein